MKKIDITKPKRIWYRHKEQIVDVLMIAAASLIVLVMLVVLIVK
jgi:hypothetical protein